MSGSELGPPPPLRHLHKSKKDPEDFRRICFSVESVHYYRKSDQSSASSVAVVLKVSFALDRKSLKLARLPCQAQVIPPTDQSEPRSSDNNVSEDVQDNDFCTVHATKCYPSYAVLSNRKERYKKKNGYEISLETKSVPVAGAGGKYHNDKEVTGEKEYQISLASNRDNVDITLNTWSFIGQRDAHYPNVYLLLVIDAKQAASDKGLCFPFRLYIRNLYVGVFEEFRLSLGPWGRRLRRTKDIGWYYEITQPFMQWMAEAVLQRMKGRDDIEWYEIMDEMVDVRIVAPSRTTRVRKTSLKKTERKKVQAVDNGDNGPRTGGSGGGHNTTDDDNDSDDGSSGRSVTSTLDTAGACPIAPDTGF